jgi:hypothetical protein
MPFSIVCSNKGCGQLQNPFLDPDTNQVYCASCDGEIANITPFVKNQMRMNKQFRSRSKEKKKAFELPCPLCKAEVRPLLVNDEILCGKCQQPMSHLTPFYVQMLKTQLGKQHREDGTIDLGPNATDTEEDV